MAKCPHCGGPAYGDKILAEKQDACYYKVKSRYKVWPSAYASGALVQCRKKGAKNWGNKSESVEDQLDEKWSTKYKRSINCNNPKGFSQRAHCQGRKKHNEDAEQGMAEGVGTGIMDIIKRTYNDNVVDWPMGTPQKQFLTAWAQDIEDETGKSISLQTLANIEKEIIGKGVMSTHGTSDEPVMTYEQGVAEARIQNPRKQ